MKKINQELIALFDKYGSDRRRALRENKKLSYLYALADLRENLLDWYQFDPEQHALQIGNGSYSFALRVFRTDDGRIAEAKRLFHAYVLPGNRTYLTVEIHFSPEYAAFRQGDVVEGG